MDIIIDSSYKIFNYVKIIMTVFSDRKFWGRPLYTKLWYKSASVCRENANDSKLIADYLEIIQTISRLENLFSPNVLKFPPDRLQTVRWVIAS